MKDYIIYKQFGKEDIKEGDLLRVDLIDGFKIKDIEELKDFKILYVSQGHEDLVSIKGKEVPRKVRYIQVFKR